MPNKQLRLFREQLGTLEDAEFMEPDRALEEIAPPQPHDTQPARSPDQPIAAEAHLPLLENQQLFNHVAAARLYRSKISNDALAMMSPASHANGNSRSSRSLATSRHYGAYGTTVETPSEAEGLNADAQHSLLSHRPDLTVVKCLTEWNKVRSSFDSDATIGLVPTMGALHPGHMALVERAKCENDVVVATIFVNPAQFNNQEDLIKYPSTLCEDLKMLSSYGTHYVLIPPVEQMYPSWPTVTTTVCMDPAHSLPEADFRPGHFTGVTTVCTKLFNIVRPSTAYFGAKDAEQCRRIQQLVADLNMPLNICVCPTERAADGLALSSRNARLNPEARTQAPIIYKALQAVEEACLHGERDAAKLRQTAKAAFAAEPSVELEYLSFADAVSGEELNILPDCTLHGSGVVVSTAANLQGVRLIDNLTIQIGKGVPNAD